MKRSTWVPKNAAERDWLRGVRDALSLMAEWDKYVSHDFRLSDCIAAKLNLITKRQVRRNKGRVAITGIAGVTAAQMAKYRSLDDHKREQLRGGLTR